MAEITMENVDTAFRSVEVNEEQKRSMKHIEEKFVELAKDIIATVPRCATRTVILRHLLTEKWAAIDAIAKGGLL